MKILTSCEDLVQLIHNEENAIFLRNSCQSATRVTGKGEAEIKKKKKKKCKLLRHIAGYLNHLSRNKMPNHMQLCVIINISLKY